VDSLPDAARCGKNRQRRDSHLAERVNHDEPD